MVLTRSRTIFQGLTMPSIHKGIVSQVMVTPPIVTGECRV